MEWSGDVRLVGLMRCGEMLASCAEERVVGTYVEKIVNLNERIKAVAPPSSTSYSPSQSQRMIPTDYTPARQLPPAKRTKGKLK